MYPFEHPTTASHSLHHCSTTPYHHQPLALPPPPASVMAWSLDYCLACDRQTNGGVYCSQACRLADLDSSNCSGPTSSTTTNPPPTQTMSAVNTGSGFYLSPAINFAAYRSPMTSTSYASQPQVANQSSYFSNTALCQADPNKALTPSSSRSSLSSNQSDSSQPGQLSEQVHSALRAYSDSFDSVRSWRRRRTWS